GYVYLRQPYQRLRKMVTRDKNHTVSDWLYLSLMVLVIRVIGDVAKMLGYPFGWLWRLREHPPDWTSVTISQQM
ncbi:MAG: hypothetical protein H0X30_20500, partial [Anaerolineae bacterium]|nr:hypothetical protein [Anaerolineae bacterium]